MKKRRWLQTSLFLFILILAACGNEETENNNGSLSDAPTGEMEPALEQLAADTFIYTLTNKTGEAVTFNFTSSQRFDFSLKNEEGEQVFLFSSVSSFMQALGEETVEPGESLSYEFDIPPLDLEAGTYQLEAWLTPKEGPDFHTESEYIVE